MTGKKLHLEFSDLHATGVGAAQHAEYGRIYVPFAFPGEKLEVEIVGESRNGQWNAVRISPFNGYCAEAGRCGGCLWPGVDYAQQLSWKEKLLRRALRSFASFAVLPVTLHPCAQMTGVRNRLHLHANFFEGRFEFGFYARGSQNLVAIGDCPMAQAPIRAVLGKMRELRTREWPALENFGFGIELVDFSAAVPGSAHTVQMVLYASPARHAALSGILRNFEELPLLQVKIRTASNAMEPMLWQHVNGIALHTTAGCFQQGNTAQSDTIRRLIGDRIAATGSRTLFDLFSGSGNYSLPFARQLTHIYGCDESETGIAVAHYNVFQNQIGNAHYVCCNVAGVLQNRGGYGWPEKVDLAILDPARFGIGKDIPALIAQVSPKEAILISNSLTALAKDSRAFLAAGFTPAALHLVDFFPNTPHMDVVTVWRPA